MSDDMQVCGDTSPVRKVLRSDRQELGGYLQLEPLDKSTLWVLIGRQ
jgi:hypothetical protein